MQQPQKPGDLNISEQLKILPAVDKQCFEPETKCSRGVLADE
jgi:hypothetical protein